MGRAGDRYAMPDGSVYELTEPTADSGGEFVGMTFTLPHRCGAPPPHVHDGITEDYEVVEGRFEVMVDGEWTELGPGDSASVPPGALHTFRNRSGAVAVVRNVHRPAARFEEFIGRVSGVLAAGGIKRPRDPRIPIYLAMLMLEYSETLGPGRARERIMLRSAAGLGRLLGLRTDA